MLTTEKSPTASSAGKRGLCSSGHVTASPPGGAQAWGPSDNSRQRGVIMGTRIAWTSTVLVLVVTRLILLRGRCTLLLLLGMSNCLFCPRTGIVSNLVLPWVSGLGGLAAWLLTGLVRLFFWLLRGHFFVFSCFTDPMRGWGGVFGVFGFFVHRRLAVLRCGGRPGGLLGFAALRLCLPRGSPDKILWGRVMFLGKP